MKGDEAACRCSDLIFHQNKIYSGRNHIITQLRSRHTEWAWNIAILNPFTTHQSNEVLSLEGFHSPTSLSRGLSIMRRHKGNFYQGERAQYTIRSNLYMKDLFLYFKTILLFSLFPYLFSRRKCCGFCFAINIPKPT